MLFASFFGACYVGSGCLVSAAGHSFEMFGVPGPLHRDPGCGRLDLAEENLRQLVRHGVPRGQISVAAECTFCNPAQFYSWRRDRESAGRMISYIRLV